VRCVGVACKLRLPRKSYAAIFHRAASANTAHDTHISLVWDDSLYHYDPLLNKRGSVHALRGCSVRLNIASALIKKVQIDFSSRSILQHRAGNSYKWYGVVANTIPYHPSMREGLYAMHVCESCKKRLNCAFLKSTIQSFIA
jgi:hypothetical protein